jgi:hypothetical protein
MKAKLATTILAASAVILTTAIQGFTMDSLSHYDWKNRVLILFGDAGDQKMLQQVELLHKQTDGLADRDMVVLQVSGASVRTLYGSGSAVDAARLKREADIDGDGFQAILVGKDGGIKLRSDEVVSDVEMFDLIDRMPMRRAGQS